MSTAVGTIVNMEGKVTEVTTDSISVAFYEVMIDGVLQKFTPVKTVAIANTEYTKDLTTSELALFKKLASANQQSTSLTDEEKLAAKSVISKLP